MSIRVVGTQRRQHLNGQTVWMIIPSYFPIVGGAEIQARLLSRNLQQNDLDVRILTRKLDRQAVSRTFEDGIEVVRIPGVGITSVDSIIFLIAGLWYLFWHGRHAIYHAHAVGAAGWLAVLAGRWFGGHSLIKLRTNVDVYEKLYSKGWARLQFYGLLTQADRLLVVSQALEHWLGAQGYAKEKVIRLPNGVDVDDFFPLSLEQKKITRESLHLPQSKRIVLYVGRLGHVKGVDILLEAWANLADNDRLASVLVIVGDGPELRHLKQMASRLQIEPSVLFWGAVPKPRELYQAADIFVLPSRAEGLSNALLEAMACSLPCVASAVGGGLDLIVHHENGMLFEPENSTQFACYLTELLREYERLDEMGHKARQTVLKEVDIRVLCNRLVGVYQGLHESLNLV